MGCILVYLNRIPVELAIMIYQSLKFLSLNVFGSFGSIELVRNVWQQILPDRSQSFTFGAWCPPSTCAIIVFQV